MITYSSLETGLYLSEFLYSRGQADQTLHFDVQGLLYKKDCRHETHGFCRTSGQCSIHKVRVLPVCEVFDFFLMSCPSYSIFLSGTANKLFSRTCSGDSGRKQEPERRQSSGVFTLLFLIPSIPVPVKISTLLPATHICTYIHSHTCTQTHTHIHTQAHTHTLTNTCTHILQVSVTRKIEIDSKVTHW